VYFTEDEEPPVVRWKSKQYIEKIMFVACIGRPIKLTPLGEVRVDNDWYWDGKVSFHPLVKLRNISRRGPNVGNPCVKPVLVSKLVFEEFLCDKVLHDIAHVVPQELFDEPIFIQMDNATPHKIDTGPGSSFYQKIREIGFDVPLKYQPSQSPDMNICDLSIFTSIQALYYKALNLYGVPYAQIDTVMQCWKDCYPKLLNYAYLMLFTNYINILACGGTSGYKFTHLGKQRLERAGFIAVGDQCGCP
jgi:hypothetical protein